MLLFIHNYKKKEKQTVEILHRTTKELVQLFGICKSKQIYFRKRIPAKNK